MKKVEKILTGFLATALIALVGVLLVGATPKASALSGSQFQPGRIIDDSLFYSPGSMSASEIQSFLNSQVPTCDTNGTQIYSGSETRAQYGTSRGYPPPYTCLKSYTQNTTAEAAQSGICGNLPAKSNQTAAQIISEVSSACGVSPKVLLVLLQKEQGLVTDDWPWSSEYKEATGYGCPDSGGCSSQYYGFFNQVYDAAWQFKEYQANPSNFNFVAGQYNNIQYSPTVSCGTERVFIQNEATAGLYDYTPYVPNTAALKNVSSTNDGGTGDGCSAYGNRNFWWYYNYWFGSTQTNPIKATVISNSSKLGGVAKVEFSLANEPSANVTIPLSISNPSEGTLNGVTSITITPANWDVPQNNVVSITGLDDGVPSGDVTYYLVAGTPTSSDPTYSNLSLTEVPDAKIINTDYRADEVLQGGNWTGSKTSFVGLKRGSEYLLDYHQAGGNAGYSFSFGRWTDTPIVGDWNGNGKYTIGLQRGNIFYLDYDDNGQTNSTVSFGRVGDTPITGDWDGRGKTEVGVVRGNIFYLDEGHRVVTISFGRVGDTPITGDWDGRGKTEVGVRRGNTFYLDENGRVASFSFGR